MHLRYSFKVSTKIGANIVNYTPNLKDKSLEKLQKTKPFFARKKALFCNVKKAYLALCIRSLIRAFLPVSSLK